METSPPIRTFSHYCRRRYGQTVGKIPLDLGILCPNRRKGGCIFCRPAAFTPVCLEPGAPLALQVAKGKVEHIHGRFARYFAYFQQESCTAMPAEELLPRLAGLLDDPACTGLILSTRPDCVEDDLLLPLAGLLSRTGKDCLIELGLQSVHEKSLALLNRNHDFADFHRAVGRITRVGRFEVGAHLIFGIPGETEAEMLESLAIVCGLGVTHLKLHHLQVIRDTVLHELYLHGRVPLFTREAYLDFLLTALPVIPEHVTIHRLWSMARPAMLVAPKWGVLPGSLSRELQARMAERGIRQGQGGRETVGRALDGGLSGTYGEQ